MSPHDSLAVHPDRSERSPTLPSSSGLCVRQIENEQQSTVGEVSQRLKVMALCRYHSTSTGWPRQRCTKSSRLRQLAEWKETNKKNPKLVPARLGAVKLHFRCDRCRNILDVGLVTRLWLCLTVSPVRSSHNRYAVYATSQRHDLWQWCNRKAIEALAGRRPTARWCCLRKLVFVRLPLLP